MPEGGRRGGGCLEPDGHVIMEVPDGHVIMEVVFMQRSAAKAEFSELDLKLYQLEAMRKWEKDALDCPQRGTAPTVKPFCKLGGWRRGGYQACEYETCFARFARNISG
jgi:hypothetical protein